MDAERNLRAASQLRKLFQEQNQQRYLTNSNNRLKRSIEKKFRTTFIGSLNQFEQAFGNWWGHNVHESKLTDDQIKLRKVWDQVRTSILNNGNNQLRAALSEIEEYTVEWNRYYNEIPFKEIKGEE